MAVLIYLSERQGEWTCLWYGFFKSKLPGQSDVTYAFPEGVCDKVMRATMRSLWKKGYVGGCPCGCRGDFEITDKGLKAIGVPRTKRYTGY